MMDVIRQWIVGVTCASVLLAITQSLMPAGGVRRVGRLAGGLLLLLAATAPLASLDGAALGATLTEYRVAESGSAALLELENERLVKEIIEEQTAAYISDKARELGGTCTAEVTYEYGDEGMVRPVAVSIRGTLTEQQRSRLTGIIETDLAIPEENQTYEGEGDP